MATYPRVPHGVDPDAVSEQERLHRDELVDDGLRDAESSMLGHFSDPNAHPQINSRFAAASHTSDEARHIGAGEVVPPTPPATGRFHLESNDGVVSWVPFP